MRHDPRLPCNPARRRKRRSHPNLRNALAAMLCLFTLGGVPPRDDARLAAPANAARTEATDASSASYAALFDRRPMLDGAAWTERWDVLPGSSFRPAVPQPMATLAAIAAPEASAASPPLARIVATPPTAPPTLGTVGRARTVPLPMSRPADPLAQTPAPRVADRVAEHRALRRSRMAALPAPTAETPSFFEELFSARRDAGPALAYAALEADGLARSRGRLIPAPEATGGTAVYDITARSVRLPSGEVLEAHSGLGPSMDNPDFVHLRMRGSTPPGTYDLTEREALFHGVRAIRLTPVGGSAAIHGRDGILAHTYMLGPSGASNGCVSFRNYDRFLQAYLRGEIRRLVVVAGRGDGPARFANR